MQKEKRLLMTLYQCQNVFFKEISQNLMGLRDHLRKLMGLAQPIEPMLTAPLNVFVHFLREIQWLICESLY